MSGSVYATTAANGHESSYACYFDDKRGTYLGDLYSVNWMEDSDVVGHSFCTEQQPVFVTWIDLFFCLTLFV